MLVTFDDINKPETVRLVDLANRGDVAGMRDGGAGDTDGLGRVGSQIGNATVVDDDNSATAQGNGFYAVAYSLGAETIISWRGTDAFSDSGNAILTGHALGGVWRACGQSGLVISPNAISCTDDKSGHRR